MRDGVRIGIDVGKARIGVSRSDPGALIATPLETVPRVKTAPNDEVTRDVQRILELAQQHDAIELVVGLPLGLGGHRTPSTDDAEAFARVLARAAASDAQPGALTVRLFDERLSTVSAQQQLRQAGRKTKGSRDIIDQAAAVVILQHAIDMERSAGRPPGTIIDETLGGETA